MLSDAQEAQIREIYYLFDTDCGGTIDMQELNCAMIALGFQADLFLIVYDRSC
jgi:Ca2+-binding EF-hand superfamily protein